MNAAPSPRHSDKATVEVATVGDGALVSVSGMIDEHFGGLGELGGVSTVVIDLSRIKFISSFGVARWIKAMASLPPTARNLYFRGCPRIFVEQLNMILKFGAHGQILTLLAPYVCTKCSAESDETIDVVADSIQLAQGQAPAKTCLKCGGALELDEIPETYFACLRQYGPRSVEAAGAVLAADVRNAPKQVIKANTPKEPKKKSGGPGKLVWTMVVTVLLAGLGVGLYVLVGPS